MTVVKRKNAPCPLSSLMTKRVLVLVDFENLFYNLLLRFKAQEARIAFRLGKLREWVKKEIGEIWGDYGFVFAPEHLSHAHQQICTENGFKLIICPKRHLIELKRNPKTGKMMSEEDTVDETIIWFGTMLMRHPDVNFICLVAGDDDYVPLFEEAPRHNVKRALAPPTVSSLSKSKRLVNLVDKHPITSRRMILRLDEL